MPLNPIFGVAPTGINTAPSQAEAEAGTATTERVWTAERVKQAIVALESSGLPRSYLAGGTLSNGTDATNDIDISALAWRSAADDADLKSATAIGKQIDVSWAAGGTPGSPTGGLSSSLTLTNDTWYHVILGLVSGTAEVGFDTSITGATLASDHSFTNTRRIGAVRRGTATNIAFSQVGDDFLWDDPPLDVDVSNQGTSSVTRTLLVPLGVKVFATINFEISHASVANQVYARSPDANDEAVAAGSAPLATVQARASGGNNMSGPREIRTGTSSDIETRSNSTSVTLRIATLGWIDRRGRDD